MTDREIIDKFNDQAATCISARESRKIRDYIWGLEKKTSVKGLFSLLFVR